MDLGGLLMGLEEHLHCKVEVMTPTMLKPAFASALCARRRLL